MKNAAQEYGPDDLPQRVWERYGLFLAHEDAARHQVGMADERRDLDGIEAEARTVAAWLANGLGGFAQVEVACRLAERVRHFPNRLFSETTTWPRAEALAFMRACTEVAESAARVAHWPILKAVLEPALAALIVGCERLHDASIPAFTKRPRHARAWFQSDLESLYKERVHPARAQVWNDSHDSNDPPPSSRHRLFALEVMRALHVRFEAKPRRG